MSNINDNLFKKRSNFSNFTAAIPVQGTQTNEAYLSVLNSFYSEAGAEILKIDQEIANTSATIRELRNDLEKIRPSAGKSVKGTALNTQMAALVSKIAALENKRIERTADRSAIRKIQKDVDELIIQVNNAIAAQAEAERAAAEAAAQAALPTPEEVAAASAAAQAELALEQAQAASKAKAQQTKTLVLVGLVAVIGYFMFIKKS